MARIPLKGSTRKPLSGARATGPADPNERLQVSVFLRRRGEHSLKERVRRLGSGDRSHGHLTREEFARDFGADLNDIAAVKTFAVGHGLTVADEHPERCTVVLSGTVAQFEAAFGVKLRRFDHPSGSFRGREGAIEIPAELDGIVRAVVGLDNRPQVRPHFRLLSAQASSAARPVAFSPIQLARLYDYPAATGQGQCVGIVEFGGGFTPADLETYFSALGVTMPTVTAVSVDGGANAPTGDPRGPDGEVMLDIEVVGAVAPEAKIAVYFAPNTDAGFLDAVTTAIHDTTNRPSVISISWGMAESGWTQQTLLALDEAFQGAAALGVTICCASGDSGSMDGETDGADHTDFPASSPHVLGCGGTSLTANSTAITSEVVWNDVALGGGAGGGGVSSIFPVPSWQAGAQATNAAGEATPLTQRGVPDVSGDADPITGYKVRIHGTDTVIGGTSAVAPLWSGLVALINQLAGQPVGFINPQLYGNAQALRDITQGNNGDFSASPGWDACTGLGSPNGQQVAAVLTEGSQGGAAQGG